MNDGHMWPGRPSRSGSGWHWNGKRAKSWGSPLGIGPKPRAAPSGTPSPRITENAPSMPLIMGRAMAQSSRGSGIVSVRKALGKPRMSNGSTIPCANAAPIWSADPCPSGKTTARIKSEFVGSSITTMSQCQCDLYHYPYCAGGHGFEARLCGDRRGNDPAFAAHHLDP
jgi:hypothetical protein